MLSPSFLQKVHNAVCAVGVLPVPLVDWKRNPRGNPLRVQGSGFLIRPDTVITNRHVLDTALAHAADHDIPIDQLFISFIAPSRLPRPIRTVRMIRRTYSPEGGQIDIALMQIRPEPDSHFEDIVPLEVADSPCVTVSEDVFICGYPYCNLLLEPEGRPDRVGPLIQQGYVSGLSPFAGSDAAEDILLDVRTAGGMSGAPVVRSTTGKVIGIHYEAMTERASITTTCFAIPVDKARVDRWLAEFEEVIRDA